MLALESLHQIAIGLIDLHAVKIEGERMSGQDWRADIERLAGGHSFTAEQMALIDAYASPGLRSIFRNATTPEARAEALKHGFQDAPGKLASNLSMSIGFALEEPPSAEDKEDIFVNARALHECLSDILENYRLMLPLPSGHADQSDYGRVLAHYEKDVLPDLDRLLDRLPRELGIPPDRLRVLDAEASRKCIVGKEHLTRIPKTDWRPG